MNQSTIRVDYHSLPHYLRKEAVERARKEGGYNLRDLMQGKADFRLTCPRDPWAEQREIVAVEPRNA